MIDASGISGNTHLVTLFGKPTHHSLSPAMHNLSFRLLGIDSVYLCFDVEPEDIGSAIAAMRVLDAWDGCNVTMPCKRAIIEHLDEIDEAAELMGAVNVVKKTDNGTLVGYNTDGSGFMANLAKHGVQVAGAQVAIIGAGGAGSAILVQAALDGAKRIDVLVRKGGPSHERAAKLAKLVSERTGCIIELSDMGDAAAVECAVGEAGILVNSTPVGMGEGCCEMPVSPDIIRHGLVVSDVIYHPRETALIKEARSRGCTAIPGLGMLIEQAARAESIWYGVQMPTAEIESRLF